MTKVIIKDLYGAMSSAAALVLVHVG